MLATQILGYFVLAGAVAAMATGAAGLFAARLRAVVIYSAILQGGYVLLGFAASLISGQGDGHTAAVFQAIAAGAGVGLMWIAARALSAEAGDSLPLPDDAAPSAWAVFCFALACMSLVGLPPLAGLPAKIAVIHAGLRAPGVLFLATVGAAALGAVSLWAYAGIVLPLITGPVTKAPVAVSLRLRTLVDVLIAALLCLGLAPYIGYAIAAAFTGGR